MQFVKVLLYFLLIVYTISTMIFMSGCSSIVVSNYCDIYKPVYSSIKDTEKTKIQIDDNNAIYEELCK